MAIARGLGQGDATEPLGGPPAEHRRPQGRGRAQVRLRGARSPRRPPGAGAARTTTSASSSSTRASNTSTARRPWATSPGTSTSRPSLPADPTLLFVWHSAALRRARDPDRRRRALAENRRPVPLLLQRGRRPARRCGRTPWPAPPGSRRRGLTPGPTRPATSTPTGAASAAGRLVLRDPQAPAATAAGAWVGLAQPPYQADFGKGPITIDWQTDGKHYQYWARADASGRFTIPNARPGAYTLYAFTDGVLGEFSRADVRVEAGKTTDLGDLTWTPVRHGRQLWEIGVPDRTAAEFRHGDHYWQWGLYNLYPQEFPNGVDFVIGKSDWKRDWNYAQPPAPDGKGRLDQLHLAHPLRPRPPRPRPPGTRHRDAAPGHLRRTRRPGRRRRQRHARRRHRRVARVRRHAPRRHPRRRALPRRPRSTPRC